MTRSSPEEAVAVLTTVPDEEVAERLAARAVEGRLAACVTMIPGIRSTYRWEGKVTTAQEVQLVFKTTAARVEELRSALEEWHPYEVPEFLTAAFSGGSDSYLQWLRAECRS